MLIDLAKEFARYDVWPTRVLHVGAHEGREDHLYQSLSIDPIYVEANPEVFERLTAALPDRLCHNVAISDHHGVVPLHVTSMDQSSSLLKLAEHSRIYPDIIEEKVVNVPCCTIDELLAKSGSKIDFLSMDIQGAEMMALRGAEATLSHVQAILSEVNRRELYKGCAMLDEMEEYLADRGFTRVRSAYPYHKSWGDALFLRDHVVKQKGWPDRMRRWLNDHRPAA